MRNNWLNSLIDLAPSHYTYVMGVFSFIHTFIPAISVAPLQVLYYSEALPTTARILYRSYTPKRTANCRYRTCPRSLRGGYIAGVELTTLRLKVIVSTKASPRPTICSD